MSRFLRLALAASASLTLALPFATTALAQNVGWPQASSDIKADPAVRFGELANGMRYAIMKNATPPHETSIRLRIGSGSLEEKDDQQGLAHFLEHMAFKGSKNVPEGEMVKLLQRHGLAFGPDTNAFTAHTQTVFMLDLPESDQETLDLGLMLMRETASNLTLSQTAMDPERGVVLSEERVRDTPDYEAFKKRLDFLMQGQLAPNRLPIGKVEVLQTAPVSRIRSYYEANYRPERATLIVVGDVDVDAMEAKIKARFSDWRGVGAPTAEPNYGAVALRGEQSQVVVRPGNVLSLQVVWTAPHDTAPDTRAKEKRDTIESLGFAVLNRRFGRIAQGDNAPFVSAGAGRADQLKSIRLASLSVNPKGSDWKSGLLAAETARRQILQYGVQPAELAREITVMRESYRQAVASAATRRTPTLAQAMAAAVDADDVIPTPAENLALFENAVLDLKVETVNAALRHAFEGQGPLLSLVSPTPIAGDEGALAAAFHEADAAPITAPESFATKAWPYGYFGTPGRVVERKEVADLGVTFVRFQNGVRLTFKPTAFRKDQVLVSFQLPGGILALPKDRGSPVWASQALRLGGLKDISLDDEQQVLAGKVYTVGVNPSEKDFVLGGTTRRADLDTEMQVLTAYLTSPGWRPAGFERLQKAVAPQIDTLDSTAGGALGRQLEALLHPGDHRWDTPTKAEVVTAKFSDLRAIWDPALASAPVEVLVVGDLTADEAIAAVARTVGSLPPRARAAAPTGASLQVHFPAPTKEPVVLHHKGRVDQAVVYEAWPTNDYYANPQEARTVSLATEVMQDRLLQRLRIAEGSTYSPSASSRPSDTFPGYGVVSAAVETPPARMAGFFAATADITADLRSKLVSADELERARKPRMEQIQKAQQTNEYWLARLAGAQDNPAKLDVIRNSLTGYQQVTPQDIQTVSRKYLRDDKAFKLVVEPEAGTTASTAK